MQVLKGLRYRAYPSEPQWPFLRHVGGCTRLVRNLALEQRERFGRRGRYFGYEGQANELKALKAEAPFLREVPHHCLQASLRDLQAAFDRFFDGVSGYPRPRRKGDDSFRFPDPKQVRIEPFDAGAWALLRLPKLGKSKGDHGALRIRLHRPMEGKLRSVAVSFEGDHCYVSLQVLVDLPDPTRPTGPALGVDRGVVVPMARSDGIAHRVPVPTKRQEERKRRLQRTLARRKRGSRNRAKAKRALGRHEASAKRRRRDALHRATTAMAKHHCLVVIEDLRVKQMTRSARGTVEQPGTRVAQKAGLNKAILAVGWGMAHRMLAYKAGWYGSELRLRNPARTSQTCSTCWHWDPRSRASRDWFRCVACGHAQHADWNAARVILGESGALLLGRDELPPENTCPASACGATTTAAKQEPFPAMGWNQTRLRRGGSLALQGEV